VPFYASYFILFVIILISGYIPFLFIESPRLLAAHRSATDAIDSSTGAAASSSAGGTLSEDAASIYMREMFLEFVFEEYKRGRESPRAMAMAYFAGSGLSSSLEYYGQGRAASSAEGASLGRVLRVENVELRGLLIQKSPGIMCLILFRHEKPVLALLAFPVLCDRLRFRYY